MTIEETQFQRETGYPELDSGTTVNNISQLPESVGRYLSFSLGQNGYNQPLLADNTTGAAHISIEPNHPVNIRTLGHFTIQSQSQNLSILAKGQHKPIEMLKALIALGGKDVGEMRLCEALWPDTDGDVAHSAFSVTLHRLRKLTGHHAVQLNDSRLSLNPEYCWVDVWTCEHLLNICNKAMSSRTIDKNIALTCIESAMHLYNGPFLGNEDEQAWYIMFRQRLHSKMLRSLLNICATLETNDFTERALDLYQKGIELEPLAEEFYFRLMRCLASLDRKAEAISVFIRCRKVFQTTIGVNPSTATLNLYRTLLN